MGARTGTHNPDEQIESGTFPGFSNGALDGRMMHHPASVKASVLLRIYGARSSSAIPVSSLPNQLQMIAHPSLFNHNQVQLFFQSALNGTVSVLSKSDPAPTMGDVQLGNLDGSIESIVAGHLEVVEGIDKDLAEYLALHESSDNLQPLCRAINQTRDLIAKQKRWIESRRAGSGQSEQPQQAVHEYEQQDPIFWKFHYVQNGLQFTVFGSQDADDVKSTNSMVAADAEEANIIKIVGSHLPREDEPVGV